ncbi:MAG: hypothetical protein Q4B61_13610 [Bacteroidales bacterium]|nr:hypothetical protein [Bacteroidales bacterium]
MATYIQKLIIEHNKDKHNRKMVANYDRKSYMENMGCARSETAHSAFLANMLKSQYNLGAEEAPIMWLLHILIDREDNATAYLNPPIPDEIKQTVLAQTLTYKIEEITTEKNINDVAQQYFNSQFPNVKVACADRLDIFIKLRIFNIPNVDYLEIIVENKVLQDENQAKGKVARVGYDDLYQTERYFSACSYSTPNRTLKLFVFLTPDEVEKQTKAKDKHFIQISYQDILDTIIVPLLDSNDLPINNRMELNNYVDALGLPTCDTANRKRIVMATRAETRSDLQTYINKNSKLIQEVITALIKNYRNTPLNADEQLLLEFAEKRRNLFAALGIDFDNNSLSSTYFYVLIYENGKWIIKHLNTKDVAVEFAKIYIRQTNVTNIGQLNRNFSSIKQGLFSNQNKKKKNCTNASSG